MISAMLVLFPGVCRPVVSAAHVAAAVPCMTPPTFAPALGATRTASVPVITDAVASVEATAAPTATATATAVPVITAVNSGSSPAIGSSSVSNAFMDALAESIWGTRASPLATDPTTDSEPAISFMDALATSVWSNHAAASRSATSITSGLAPMATTTATSTTTTPTASASISAAADDDDDADEEDPFASEGPPMADDEPLYAVRFVSMGVRYTPGPRGAGPRSCRSLPAQDFSVIYSRQLADYADAVHKDASLTSAQAAMARRVLAHMDALNDHAPYAHLAHELAIVGVVVRALRASGWDEAQTKEAMANVWHFAYKYFLHCRATLAGTPESAWPLFLQEEGRRLSDAWQESSDSLSKVIRNASFLHRARIALVY